jgi:NAD dependent epimerase/dehydratase family enzyme
MPWIDLDDAVGALHRAALDATFDGVYNVVSPEGAPQGELATTLARVLGRPVGPPLPEFAVSALFGEMGREALLASTHAVPTRLQAAGFEFGAPSLEAALRLMLGKQVKTHG